MWFSIWILLTLRCLSQSIPHFIKFLVYAFFSFSQLFVFFKLLISTLYHRSESSINRSDFCHRRIQCTRLKRSRIAVTHSGYYWYKECFRCSTWFQLIPTILLWRRTVSNLIRVFTNHDSFLLLPLRTLLRRKIATLIYNNRLSET